MSYKGTSFQKHAKDYSLASQPLTQPNIQGHVHSISITDKENNSLLALLNHDEAIQLRDCLLKAYPLNQGE